MKKERRVSHFQRKEKVEKENVDSNEREGSFHSVKRLKPVRLLGNCVPSYVVHLRLLCF